MSHLERIAIAWAGQFAKLSRRHRPIATDHPYTKSQVVPARVALAFALTLVFAACERNAGLPKPDSQEYRELVTAFYVGLAGLQTGEDVRAKEKLTRATEIAPGEPASWANLGLLAVRQQEFDTAYEKVEKARTLAPDNSQIEALLGLIESRRGKLPEATAHLKKAVELDPKNLRALYALAQETERQGAESSDAEAQALLQKILETQPDNLAVLLDVTRLAAKRGAGDALNKTVAKLSEKSSLWPEEALRQMAALRQAASGENPRSAAPQVAFLRNVLARVPEYRQSLNAVKTPAEFVGEPFTRFIKLPSPSSEPAAADTATTFEAQPIPGSPEGAWNWIGAIAFDDEAKPAVTVADGYGIRITGGANINLPRENRNFVTPVDFNYDFKTDLVVESKNGVRFLQQESLNAFTDVTARTGLPEQVLKRGYVSAGTIDFDLDGDLDIWLSPDALKNKTRTTPIVLRNKGDGTFDVAEPFKIVYSDENGLDPEGRPIAVWQTDLVNADIDEDGDPDTAMVGDSYSQSGWRLRVFSNERLGQFRERQAPQEIGNIRAINAADLNGDGKMDLVAVSLSGQIFRLSDKDDGKAWDVKEVAMLNKRVGNDQISPGKQRLLIADLDNNGGLDLIVESTESVWRDGNTQEGNRPNAQIFLNEGNEKFTALPALRGTGKISLVDTNGDGRLELIGIAAPPGFAESGSIEGPAAQLINRGSKNYNYQIIRTRAAKATGDQRINSFGIGGEIEIRSGLLTQKQVITSPILHFGLGENTQTDVARIVWPNGSAQAEFELKAGQSVLAEQRLKGSCPMLFAWDGNRISYVKDTAPWSPALGLRINAQVVAGIYQTEEWFKISGDKIAPRDGFYDLRVTAELWEVYYIDHYSLMAVDHPQGTEVFSDERFAVPPPPLKLYATSALKAFASAKDDLGQDVTTVVRDLDQKYLGTFGKGRYQGITRDHWVELELPADAPRDKQLYLIGDGFVHPTDGSINVAYGQTGYPPPQGLSIETPDAQGKWATAKPGLGFPAGKLKTVVLDLSDIFRPGAPRKLRLRTSMEIYWDRLEWAEALPDTTFKTQRINLSSAELRYRGFSKFSQADDSSPELPDYNQFEGTAQKWRDMIGYYTRYGEARELLEKIDDRMLITCAGDELRLKFAALPAPPAGWTRDYVMVGDGWIKDGDLNSTFSKTVLPLPYHGLKDYNIPPGRLEDDPAYKRHPQDWQTYHTRYVTPEFFLKALRN
jgi:Tfp pilus assembly protein PilF